MRPSLPRARLHHDGGNPHRPAADVLETKDEPSKLRFVLHYDFYGGRRLEDAFVKTEYSSQSP